MEFSAVNAQKVSILRNPIIMHTMGTYEGTNEIYGIYYIYSYVHQKYDSAMKVSMHANEISWLFLFLLFFFVSSFFYFFFIIF